MGVCFLAYLVAGSTNTIGCWRNSNYYQVWMALNDQNIHLSVTIGIKYVHRSERMIKVNAARLWRISLVNFRIGTGFCGSLFSWGRNKTGGSWCYSIEQCLDYLASFHFSFLQFWFKGCSRVSALWKMMFNLQWLLCRWWITKKAPWVDVYHYILGLVHPH